MPSATPPPRATPAPPPTTPARPHGRRRPALRAVLTAVSTATALLLAGCSADRAGGGGEPAGAASPAAADDILLQPLAAPGPDPFTASTARTDTAQASPPPVPSSGPSGPREVTGSTPGLYGGVRSRASCDVERQIGSLTSDPDRTRAFAEAAGIPEAHVGGWLRGLTPVVLRVDTRVTNHRYRDGKATAFPSVLQAGTAVLVDRYGAPRVRCACGNPLRGPAPGTGGVHRGDPWSGFDPERVVVVRPTTTVVTSLVIVNLVDGGWVERRIGSDGDEDRAPAKPPACDPDTCHLTGTPTPDSPSSDGTPPAPTTPDPSASDPASPPEADPTSPDPSTPAPEEQPGDPEVPPMPETPEVPDMPVVPDPADPGEPWAEPVAPADPADPGLPPMPDPYPDPSTDPYPDSSGDVPPETFPG
ncbi:DUF6777 domain-containing protein [Streptomyces gulbargensis]|uniref:DUF6777 domain-containing protein n=1 Tax=Streptomyces gulbargensis TaxID=364901 RepID=UPI0031F0481B